MLLSSLAGHCPELEVLEVLELLRKEDSGELFCSREELRFQTLARSQCAKVLPEFFGLRNSLANSGRR